MGSIIKRIGIIGTGNLGYQLAIQADKLNYQVGFVYNRTPEKAHELAGLVDAKAITELQDIVPCDIIFLTVPDDQIESVVKDLSRFQDKLQETIVVHCSGATSIEVLKIFSLAGVLYPLQTFTKNKVPDWDHIPIFVEGCNKEIIKILETFAGSISRNVHIKNSDERKKIHCGAIFVSNFVHALAHIAIEISEQADFKTIYYPLIYEVIQKLQNHSPTDCLTGPAKRKDLNTLKAHIELIQDSKIKQIYQLLSQYIQENMM